MIGLFKKVVLADGIAVYADPVFDAAAAGQFVGMLSAWGGALAYTCQLYFDFSGYSDMAIGLGVLFGVRLPMNFYSPYKAASIIEFWRRWHISLSRFLRDYLYVPLGGNRQGPARRHVNLMITMLLGGLWHGAGWTFVLWGGLHGVYLIVNHLWRSLRRRLGLTRTSRAGAVAGWALTFVAVVVAWVVFRAPTVDAALLLLKSMAGLNGPVLPADIAAWQAKLLASHELWLGSKQLVSLAILLALCWLAPNTYQLTRRFRPVLSHPLLLQARDVHIAPAALRWAVAYGFLLWGIFFGLPTKNAFIYFNF
jgi:D-alanyl-lipoteichoic acid acyltransferase DltB (MBOAT superfamily)